MKTLQTVPHWSPGGLQRVAQTLHRGLTDAGVDDSIVSLRSGDDQTVVGGMAWEGVRVWWRLLGRMTRDQPNAVIAHGPMTGLITLSAAAAARRPSRILVIHEMPGTGRRHRVERLVGGAARVGLITDVVFVSRAMRDAFVAQCPVLGPRAAIIHNGVVVPKEPIHDASRPPGQVLLFVGRLIHSKNVETLIRMAADLRRDWPLLELRILGHGPEFRNLEALATQLRSPARFVGEVPAAHVWESYWTASLLVFASSTEGLPLTLIEAASAGLPMVVSDIPGNREVMATAARYPTDSSVGTWTRTVDELLRNPGERERLASAGAARSKEFTVGRMVRGYISVIEARN